MSDVEIQQTKAVWRVVGNTDNTEGRGASYTMCVCETEVTARRHAKGNGVMGGDCRIEESRAFLIDGKWFIRGEVEIPTKDDKRAQVQVDELREIRARMKAAGFTDEEIRKVRAHG